MMTTQRLVRREPTAFATVLLTFLLTACGSSGALKVTATPTLGVSSGGIPMAWGSNRNGELG